MVKQAYREMLKGISIRFIKNSTNIPEGRSSLRWANIHRDTICLVFPKIVCFQKAVVRTIQQPGQVVRMHLAQKL